MDTVSTLVEQYLPLANKIAYKRKKLLPRFIDIEDLQSAAYMGLVQAANRYRPEFNVDFMTYAYPRIDGAVKDWLREQRRHGTTQSLDDPGFDEDAVCLKDTLAAPEERQDEEFFETVSMRLGGKAEGILRSYLVDNCTMKELGQQYNLTEGRISQLIKEYRQRYAELREIAA